MFNVILAGTCFGSKLFCIIEIDFKRNILNGIMRIKQKLLKSYSLLDKIYIQKLY